MLRASTAQPLTTKEAKKIVVKKEEDDGTTIDRRLMAIGARPRAKSAPIQPSGLNGKRVSSTSSMLRNVLLGQYKPLKPFSRRRRFSSAIVSPSPAPSSVCTQTTSGLRLGSSTPLSRPYARPRPSTALNGALHQSLTQRTQSIEVEDDNDDDDVSIISVSRNVDKPPPVKYEYTLRLTCPDCLDIIVPLSAPLMQNKHSTGLKIQRRLKKTALNIAQDILQDC